MVKLPRAFIFNYITCVCKIFLIRKFQPHTGIWKKRYERRTNGTKGILFFLFASLRIRRTIENTAAIVKASAKSSRLLQNPRPMPVTHKTKPSPVPIFPPVNLPMRTTHIPINSPSNLSNIDKAVQKGMQIHKRIAHRMTNHTFIFFLIKSSIAVMVKNIPRSILIIISHKLFTSTSFASCPISHLRYRNLFYSSFNFWTVFIFMIPIPIGCNIISSVVGVFTL